MRSLRRPHPISPQPPLSLLWWGPGCAGAGLMDGGSSPPPPPVPLPAAPAQGHKGIMSPQPLNTLPHPCPTAWGGWLCVTPPTGPGQACGTARVSLPTHRCVPAADAAPPGRSTSHHHPCWLSDTLPEPDSAGAGGTPWAHSRSRGRLCLHLVTACAYIAPSCSERSADHDLSQAWYTLGGSTRGDVPWYAACAPDPSLHIPDWCEAVWCTQTILLVGRILRGLWRLSPAQDDLWSPLTHS